MQGLPRYRRQRGGGRSTPSEMPVLTAEAVAAMRPDDRDVLLLRLSATVRSMEDNRGHRIDAAEFEAWEAEIAAERALSAALREEVARLEAALAAAEAAAVAVDPPPPSPPRAPEPTAAVVLANNSTQTEPAPRVAAAGSQTEPEPAVAATSSAACQTDESPRPAAAAAATAPPYGNGMDISLSSVDAALLFAELQVIAIQAAPMLPTPL